MTLTEARARVFAPKYQPVLVPLTAVGVALTAGFFAMLLGGRDAVSGYGYLAQYALGSPAALGESSIKAAVLTLTGLSVAVGLNAGVFNIGAEGQFTVGALAAAWLGHAVDLPAPLELALCAAGAMSAGAAWALIAAWLKVRRGVHEVISTIMLNWIALHLVQDWLVVGPLRAPSSDVQISVAGTAPIHASAELPRLVAGSRLDLGVVYAALAVLLCWLFLRRSVAGFQVRVVGAAPEAARAAGMPGARRVYQAMALSGALAALAGLLLVLGTEHRYPGTFRTGYGFDGIAVALVGAASPLGTAAAGIFFGLLRAGAKGLQLVGIQPSFADLLQGASVWLVSAPLLFAAVFRRLRGARAP